MPRLAANLSTLFTELPFAQRFAAAAAAGFRHVECQFPYALPAEQVAAALAANGLSLVLFNVPPGDPAAGDRGLGSVPGREAEFRDGFRLALNYAQVAGCTRLHVMAGLVAAGADPGAHRDVFVANLRWAADAAVGSGITLMLEPINTRVDVPLYFLSGTAQALELMAAVDRPNLRLQFDCYHMQIMEGDLARSIERLLPSIGHIQIADNPGRHEPGTGEIHYAWLLAHLDTLGYEGFVGCEYLPLRATADSLGWATRWLGPAGPVIS